VSHDAGLDGIYERRFGDADSRSKDGVWAEVVPYLARWIPADARVLDVACDRGYFIRHVVAAERWATDLRDVSADVGPEVRFVQGDGLAIAESLPNAYFDVAFTSNYLEHLPTPDAVIEQLRAMRAVLRPGGRLVVIQPNIRYAGAAYWDFIDHRTALTERSLVEAAESAGFSVEHVVPRFLPYSTKGRLPRARWLVRLYLRFPLAWRILGAQTLLVARAGNSRSA